MHGLEKVGWGVGVGKGVRTGAVGAEEEFAVAGDDGLEEGAAVFGGLGRGLAVVVHVGGPVVDEEGEMVGGLFLIGLVVGFLDREGGEGMGLTMVPTTLGPSDLTASMASAEVQCSRTIFRAGYLAAKSLSTGMKRISAFMTVTPSAALLGTSPCRFSTTPSSSMALSTSWKGSKDTTPHCELVVAPRG